jgi:hypothetical protein
MTQITQVIIIYYRRKSCLLIYYFMLLFATLSIVRFHRASNVRTKWKECERSDNSLSRGALPHSYAGDEKIHEMSVRVASVQAEIWTHVNTYKKRLCHIFDNGVIYVYVCCRTIIRILCVRNLHLMLTAISNLNCLEQERKVTFVGLVDQLIRSIYIRTVSDR